MKKFGFFALIFLGVIGAGGVFWFSLHRQLNTNNTPVVGIASPHASPVRSLIQSVSPLASPSQKPKPSPTVIPVVSDAPVTKLTVPFTSQAPFAVWDALHEDACEEASFLMVKLFLNGDTLPAKETVDSQLLSMVAWEENHGYGPSITMSQLNTIALQEFGIASGKVVQNITTEDIKTQIRAGNPVILGMAGKLLKNPNFTNDPGTRNGQNYHYAYSVFFAAIHDWDAGTILNGAKDMLVFSKQ